MIKVNDLAVGYNGKAVASGVTFEVPAGGTLYITGENGCGKSTLLATLTGQLKKIGGEMQVNGSFSYGPRTKEVCEDFPLSVKETVCGTGRYGLSTEEERKLGISGLLKKPYRMLSGGQKEKVLIARALNTRPDIVFLDEPTTGLDPESSQSLKEMVRSLSGTVTFVIVTHDSSFIDEGEGFSSYRMG